jgi:uncharacterized protein (TIGR02145 family)
MKAKSGFREGEKRSYVIRLLVVSLLTIELFSCQKNEIGPEDFESMKDPVMISLQDLSSDCSFRNLALYYGHVKFRRDYGAPVTETRIISNPDFSCFGDLFVLKIRSSMDKRTRVASGEVWIDGKLIVRQSDFNKHTYLIVKHIYGLKPESKLEVKLNGTPGSYIDLWIEGIMKKVTPVFDRIGPLCQYSKPPVLPANSLNDPPVSGTWSPEVISTMSVGKTTFTFTPAEGQCGSVVKMEVEVVPAVIPVFEQIGPLVQGSVPPSLPLKSANGIIGTWTPDKINTAVSGDFKFNFAPDPGQCSTPAELIIKITQSSETISDIDGNVYKIVKIGDQWWMAENLKTTKYNNGDLIGTTTPATLDISGQTEPKYQWAYNGDESNVATYGRLYTWYTVMDSRGVCPAGWHIPSDAEWTCLTDFLTNNGYGYEGSGNDIAKSMAATNGWIVSTITGTTGNDPMSNNMSGFTALPGGYRIMGGSYQLLGRYGSWWSSTDYNATSVWFRFIYYNESLVTRTGSDKKQGGAVRCTKDN